MEAAIRTPLAVIKNLYEQRAKQNRPPDYGVEEYFAEIISQTSSGMVRNLSNYLSCDELFVRRDQTYQPALGCDLVGHILRSIAWDAYRPRHFILK